MQIRLPILSAIVAVTLAACSSDHISAPPPPPPPTGVLLKDVVYTRLPSPYYHFEYDDAGKIRTATFASGLATYSLNYQTGRIHDIDVTAGTVHNLIYTYDDLGRVAAIRDRDETGANAQLWFFTYAGQQLTSIERDRAVPGGFIIDLTMSFEYYADGNLLEMGQHYPPIDGLQSEVTLVDVFENYDNKVNVDDFDLLHPGFFDKLILLPGVKLQKGNPARVVHLGDGDHYTVDFSYTYNDQTRPLTRNGTLIFQTGPNAGQSFAVDATYSYY
jgi:YD repeat-containing protein